MYRQGDVCLKPEGSRPAATPVPRENGRIVLAHGERTGHTHAVVEADARLWQDEHGVRFLETGPGGARLRHEEHETIVLPPGLYRVLQQREFVPEHQPRAVFD